MADREPVITHLMIIRTWAKFARERDMQFFTEKHLENMVQWADDAIAILEEQKAVEPVESNIKGVLLCGSCKCSLMREEGYRFRHCPWCGRRVKWE